MQGPRSRSVEGMQHIQRRLVVAAKLLRDAGSVATVGTGEYELAVVYDKTRASLERRPCSSACRSPLVSVRTKMMGRFMPTSVPHSRSSIVWRH